MKWGAALAALSAVGLISAAARADVCGSAQNVSCHTTQPTKEQSTMGAAVPLGHYTPLIWNEGHVRIEPPANPKNNATGNPGIDITLGAGGWGKDGAEPMAIARTSINMLVGQGVYGYFEPKPGIGINFDCPNGPVLCSVDSAGSRLLQTANSQVRRRYRVRQTNPAPLPNSVTAVPVKVDFRVAIYISGNSDFGRDFREGLTSSVSVQFGSLTISKKARVECGGGSTVSCSVNGAAYAPIQGTRLDGTLTYQAPIAALDQLMLHLGVGNFVERGACVDMVTPEGTYCLIKPWRASGHGVADPYVYIDPSWQYASWFALEMSADETDTTWVTPQRTNVDLETLTGLVESDAGVGVDDAGVAPSDAGASANDAGVAADDTGISAEDAGEQPTDGDAGVGEESDAGESGGKPRRDAGADDEEDEDTAKSNKGDGGGCHVAGGADSLAGGLLLLAGFALMQRRRRARR